MTTRRPAVPADDVGAGPRRFWKGWPRGSWANHWRRARLGALGALSGIGLAAAVWYGVPWAVPRITSHPYFATTIEMDGNRRLSRSEVLEWAQLHDGMSVWDAAPSVVRARLQSHPWIERVHVQRDLPNRLMLRVQERRPVAIARLDQLYYVDRSARFLGPLQSDDSRDLTVITGLEPAATRPFATVGVHRALQLLRLCERISCFEGLSEIHIDRHRGATLFPLHMPVAIVVGWGGWREKLARSGRAIAAWRGQATRLATVDVSFRDLVVVKLREEQSPAPVRSPKRGLRV